MSRRRDVLGGGRLLALFSVLLLAMSALILWQAGTGEAGLRMWIRATARTSLALFAAAFVASSLRALWRTPATAWLLRNRRYLGLSFAVSHALHLLAIISLSTLLGDAFEVDAVTLIFGGGAYLMIALMAATSSDRAYAWLGRRRWHLLHKIGVYWIWIIFANSYTARGVVAVARGTEPLGYLPVALFIWAILGVRILAWTRARSARSAPAIAA
jgi:DMSO/TMAO reductase YedYZ heme-binding membrane subunit